MRLGSPSASTPVSVSALPGRSPHPEDGFYVNFRFDMPLPFVKKYEFVVENRGEFFALSHPTDSPIDTRFFDDLRSSFVVPIRGHLNMSTSFELQLFENKVNNSLYRSTNSNVSLTYAFDWRSGLRWRDVWLFNNPVPPLTSLPNR